MVFHNGYFYSTTMTTVTSTTAFLQHLRLDPYIRRFVRHFCHSNHRYFIDPRHIGDTIHLWTAFVWLVIIQQVLRSLFADFTGLQTIRVSSHIACRSIREGVSGRYPFHSTFWIISSETIRFLPLFRLYRPVEEQVALFFNSITSVSIQDP